MKQAPFIIMAFVVKQILCMLLVFVLFTYCKTAKPVDTMPEELIQVTVDSLGVPIVAYVPVKKPTFMQSLFGVLPKTKLKNVTISVNTQTATGGSTIGANEQGGADISKVKRSAVSEAKTANTGGQGSKVDGDSKADATNKQGGNSLWWYALAFGGGFALRQFGPILLRFVRPV